MPIDNRKVLQNIRIPPTKDGSVQRRVLTSEDADEITSMFSQEQIDRFVAEGALEGDWKSSMSGAAKSDEKQTETEENKTEKAEVGAKGKK